MSKHQLRTIYLAGPITGCNDDQKKVWRDRIRRTWSNEFNFYCPVERLEALSEQGVRITPYQVVNLDMKAIRESDAVIANMWKESIGTGIGVAIAAFNGKPVVVIDKNMLKSHTLNFYSYAVVKDEDEAIQRLKEYFRTVDRIETVQKSKGKPDEPFRIDKLVVSIRNACYAAGQDEFLATAEVVPEVLAGLAVMENADEKTVSSSAIKNAVFDVLARLENDEEKGQSFQRIRQAWDQFNKKSPLTEFVPVAHSEIRLFSDPQTVTLSNSKSHKLLWGKLKIRKLEDIPVSARGVFREICRVDGISEIHFGGIDGPPHHGPCKVELSAHKNQLQIKGICFDEGKFGGSQAFKIRVRDRSLRDPVLNTLREHLRSLNLLNWREKQT